MMGRVPPRASGQPRPGVHTEALLAPVVAWWASIQKKRPYLANQLPNNGGKLLEREGR